MILGEAQAVRIETIPLILGILVVLIGLAIVLDAWTPDGGGIGRERRRRPRVERHRGGEALIGLGVIALGAAIIGRDGWRYSIVVVLVGAVFLVAGAVLNGQYVRQLLVNRGPLRRREDGEDAPLRADVTSRPKVAYPTSPERATPPAKGKPEHTASVTPAPTPSSAVPSPPPPPPSTPPIAPGDGSFHERRSRPRGK